MVVSTFFILNKNNEERFFKKSFILVDIKLDIVFEILLLTINNIDIDFLARDLQ